MADPIHDASNIIESELQGRICAVEDLLDADLVSYMGAIDDGAHHFLKKILETRTPKRPHLAVILETEGGYIESAERIAHAFRYHYSAVSFIVLSYAMSAGTVLVMCGDHIYMDYSATLGPIDPQVQRAGSQMFVPALGYLEQYERLIKKSAAGTLTTAELAYLIQKFDPAELYRYEQARDLSIALLEEWLVKYKFKNWTTTETKKTKVTATLKRKRATEIAKTLNETARWHSHSRGITMEVLQRDLKLQIEDIEKSPDLQKALTDYYTLLNDYRYKRGHFDFLTHWKEGYHGH